MVKRFGGFTAVDGLALLRSGRANSSFARASSCSKTTLLRLLAGFRRRMQARSRLGGADIARVLPHERPVNMFQNYALFPHPVGRGQRTFRPQARDCRRKDEIAARVAEMIALKGPPRRIAGASSRSTVRRPAAAYGSGARAGATARYCCSTNRFAALDKLREYAGRTEGDYSAASKHVTFIIVTHDQEGAMTVTDRIRRDG